ncbi:MAG: hypothetical protein R2704_08945 [Microthrixaceae bacterium]
MSSAPDPRNSSTNWLAGLARMLVGESSWATLDCSRRMAILSPIFTASSMSWVTNTIVFCISSWRRRNSFCKRSRVIGSMAPNGSSINNTSGSAASALATPTRWACPPESSLG